MQKTNSAPEAKAAVEREDMLKKRAARQAAKRELAPTDHAKVKCVVLPAGDGRISMGEHVAGLGEVHYEDGEEFETDLPIAINLYLRNFVNFDGAKEAVAEWRQGESWRVQAERRAKEEQDRVLNGQ